ncbi:hypothetical protein PRIPAC_76974 [Pristionchus pacificus]|uniref:Uncharacterized protein n=1 Tax=Pristionchus pacificus TaxID=54126 RepID=A0A2A6CKQ6_PRIPA|nr:hypothetical protein PRIPAC_76974 [Pristionchus pacificus]|eukprot:PDM78633.1 hypothetical protein PRIPAC_31212 [Pristionchus pacificus]
MVTIIDLVGNFLSPDWDFGYACCREAILFTNVLYGLFLLVDTLLFSLYIYVFVRNKTLHANFRVILLILAVNDMALIYHRLADFWLTGVIDRENGFTYFIKMHCWVTLIFSLCNIIGERSFSLYAYQWYHDKHWRFPPIIIVYVFQETAACLLITNRVISKNMIMDCLTVMTIFTALFLIAIYRSSRRRNRQMIATRFQWCDGESLSRRHRTMEILRENRLLQAFLPYLVISTLIQDLEALIVVHIIVPIDHRYYLVAHCVFYLTISIRVLFDLLIPILVHPVIRTDAKKTLIALGKKFRLKSRVIAKVAPVTTTKRRSSIIHSTNGQRLSFSPEEEKEMYFTGYAQLWGAPPGPGTQREPVPLKDKLQL